MKRLVVVDEETYNEILKQGLPHKPIDTHELWLQIYYNSSSMDADAILAWILGERND